jgi:hypothetical protein
VNRDRRDVSAKKEKTVMKTTIKGNILTIEIELNGKPPASSSGKTKLAASTGGFTATGIDFLGKPLKLSVMATIPND